MDFFNNKLIERVIYLIFVVYSLILATVSIIFEWSTFLCVFALIGLICVSIVIFSESMLINTRSYILSVFSFADIILCSIYSGYFAEILIIIGTIVLLLGLYHVPGIVYMGMASTTFLLFYHIFVLKTFNGYDEDSILKLILKTFIAYFLEILVLAVIKMQLSIRKKLSDTIYKLERAKKSKDDFLANMSHEIRTPMNAVCGMSELILRDETISSSVRNNAFDIQVAGKSLLSIINDILDFSKIESGKMEIIKDQYNIASTLNDVLNMSVIRKGNKDIEIIVDCPPDIPVGLLGDEVRFRQVIMNLLTNAIKFTKEGCIVLSVSVREEYYGVNLLISVKDTGIGMTEEGMEKLFGSFSQLDTRKNRNIEGTGLGLAISKRLVSMMGGFIQVKSRYGIGSEFKFVIPQNIADPNPFISIKNPEKVSVVFYINLDKNKFEVVAENYRKVIRNIVTSLKIKYTFCSTLKEFKEKIDGEGEYTHIFIGKSEYSEATKYFEKISEKISTIVILEKTDKNSFGGKIKCMYKPFYILPFVNIINGENNLQMSMQTGVYDGKAFEAPSAKILVVDDNEMNLKVVSGLMRPYKMQIFTATSGFEAIQKLKKSQDYDIVFMDHMMPKMDGIEATHIIRMMDGEYYKKLPIIALTANAVNGAREMFIKEGFQDFISKPIEISLLERTLKKWLGKHILSVGITSVKKENQNQYVPSNDEDGFGLNNLKSINLKKGLYYSGDNIELYKQFLEIYYKNGLEKILEIQKMYEEGNWSMYVILVHALKSTSLNIGAEELSAIAKQMEFAGKEERIADIHKCHNEMMSMYREILEEISKVIDFSANDSQNETKSDKTNENSVTAMSLEKDKKPIKNEKIKQLVEELKEAVEMFDRMNAIAIAKSLKKYGSNDEICQKLDEVCEFMENYNFDEAENIINSSEFF